MTTTETHGVRAPGRPSAASSDAGKRSHRSRREARAAFWFLLPDSIGLLVFVFVPMVLAIALGFFRVDGFGNATFIGVANYTRMAGDPAFWQAVRVTGLYLIILVPAVFVVSLLLALLVQQRIPFVGVIRSALFAPYVISLVVVGLLWQFMLADRVGVVNTILAKFGIHDVSFLGDPK